MRYLYKYKGQTWPLYWFKFRVKIYTLWLFEWHVWPWWLTRHQSRGKMVEHPDTPCPAPFRATPLLPSCLQLIAKLTRVWILNPGILGRYGNSARTLTENSRLLHWKQFFDGTNGARALIFPGLLLSDEIIENNDIHIIRVDKSDNDCGVSWQRSLVLLSSSFSNFGDFLRRGFSICPLLGTSWWGRLAGLQLREGLGEWSLLHTWTKVQCTLHTWTKMVTSAHLDMEKEGLGSSECGEAGWW